MIHIQLTGSCDSLGSCLPLRVLCSLSSISNDYPIPLCKGSPKACRPYIVSLSCVGRQVSMQLHNLISLSRFMRSMPHAAHEEQEHNLAAHHPLAPSVRSLLYPRQPLSELRPTACLQTAQRTTRTQSPSKSGPCPLCGRQGVLLLLRAMSTASPKARSASRTGRQTASHRPPSLSVPHRANACGFKRLKGRARQGQLEPAGPSPRPPLKCAAPPPPRFGPIAANPAHIEQP